MSETFTHAISSIQEWWLVDRKHLSNPGETRRKRGENDGPTLGCSGTRPESKSVGRQSAEGAIDLWFCGKAIRNISGEPQSDGKAHAQAAVRLFFRTRSLAYDCWSSGSLKPFCRQCESWKFNASAADGFRIWRLAPNQLAA